MECFLTRGIDKLLNRQRLLQRKNFFNNKSHQQVVVLGSVIFQKERYKM